MEQSDTREEAVYDAYLDACAAGDPEPPEAVFFRNPGIGDVVRARIEELWRATSQAAARGPASSEISRLGGYRLLERLGSGGMGSVFRAVRESDGTELALKVLRPDLAGSATATERLRREALALSRLRHPHVVRVHGFGEDRGTAFLVLDLVPGQGLDEILADAAARGELISVERVARWGAALARGLAAAHAEGVVHRDVKPSNVRVRPDDTPLLIDFGIATVPERTRGALTTTFAGSPFYAAPEQLAGAAIDGRTDVYGLCAALYQCLTGRVPFAGDRFEDVLRRTLTESPVSLRRLAPHVPRPLETVVMAGLEKDPSRRPESAAALAEDLESGARGGRVRSRRPGPLRLLARWARRRPFAAAAAALAALAISGVVAANEVARRAEGERVLGEARAGMREAVQRTAAYAAAGAEEESLSGSVVRANALAQAGWLSDVELARLDDEDETLDQLRRERDAAFHGILALLDRAERLVPGIEGLDACRARLHLVRWREATAAGDAAAAAFYRSMVERADPGGPAQREVSGSAALSIVPDPPDAEVHLFRVVVRADVHPGGGRRFVAVPIRGEAAGLPTSAPWALRVVRGAGNVPEGAHVVRVAGHAVEACVLAGRAESGTVNAPLADGSASGPISTAGRAHPLPDAVERLVEIGGVAVRDVADALRLGAPGPERHFVFARGNERLVRSADRLDRLGVRPVSAAEAAERGDVAATLWDDGALRETRLPAGLRVRVTAAPLLAGAASRVDPAEAASLRLPPGEYVVLLRHAERAEVRIPVNLRVPGSSMVARASMPSPADRPPGCVLVTPTVGDTLPVPVWCEEREVTAAEYLEFLNDPATRAEIDAAPRPVRVPRHEVDPPLWRRGPDGLFRLPADVSPEHPLLGVSFEDALAYAAWRTGRAAARGEPWRWRLPTYEEWLNAAGAILGREYPFGPRFHPRWASSCFARPAPAPEPVLTYPVDESPFGVFDMCGSAMEWVDAWYDEPRGLRRLAGGSWAQGDSVALRTYSPHGARPDRADREFGIRLVAERREERAR